jgi:hypothetical protein
MSRKLPGTLYHTMGCRVVIFLGSVNVLLVSDRLYPTWPRMSERVMSGKLAILPSEVKPLTQVCGTLFHALWFAISK